MKKLPQFGIVINHEVHKLEESDKINPCAWCSLIEYCEEHNTEEENPICTTIHGLFYSNELNIEKAKFVKV